MDQNFEQSTLENRLRRHTDRLKLGSLFPCYDATWRENDAWEMMKVICNMCDILDNTAPKLIQDAISARRVEIGMEEIGSIPRMTGEAEGNGFRQILQPVLNMLKEGSRPGFSCTWNQRGCRALYELLTDMVDRICTKLPATIHALRNASHEELRAYVKPN